MAPDPSFRLRTCARAAPTRPAGALGRAPAGVAAMVLGLWLCSAAQAQNFLYSCKVDGHTYSGQLPPAECKKADIRVLNPDGSLHHTLPAPLTAEERRKRDEDEEKQRQAEEAQHKQEHEDRALLETYSSVDEIEAARKRDLAGQQGLIDRADSRLQQYQREHKRLDEEAEFYVKHDMPPKLKEAYATNKVLSDQQEKAKANAMLEMQHINARYDEKRKRFVEIMKRAEEAQAARRAAEAQQQ